MICRKTINYTESLLATFAVGLFLSVACSQARAGGAADVEPLQLRKIMQELTRNMQNTTSAISIRDWGQVAKLAPQIATHPQPSLSEKMRILAYLGADARRFREFDKQTHESAYAMGDAARRGDGKAVIQSFAKVQESCLACHQEFRKPFLEHFYGQH